MAKVDAPTVVKSVHFPHRLEYLLRPDEEAPGHSKTEERLIITLGWFGWRLKRARLHAGIADKLAKELRDLILARFPDVYGVRVYNQHSVRIIITTDDQTVPVSASQLISYLGAHAPEVITGVTLPLAKLLDNPANYRRLVEALVREFGDELADEVGVTYSKEKLSKLVETGQLEPPPDDMFRTAPSTTRRVLVDRIDNRGQVIKESNSRAA